MTKASDSREKGEKRLSRVCVWSVIAGRKNNSEKKKKKRKKEKKRQGKN